jgi:hypothetical protein
MTQQYLVEIIGKDKTGQAFQQVQGNADRAKKSILNLKNAIIAIGTGAVVRSIINTTARFEDLRTSLTSVTGSAEAGADAFNFISRFATKTQFGIEDLTETFIKLEAAGIRPTEKLLTTFTDTAAVTTDQIGSLQAITDLFARSISGGLGLEDLNRLADRGVPVFRILEEQLGLTRLEVSKFGQTAEGANEIREALVRGLDESFGGATAERVKNLSTRISNLQIAFINAQDSLGQGLNVALGDTIVEITELIEKNDELIKQFGVGLGDAIERSTDLAKSLVTPLKTIGETTGGLIDGFLSLPPYVQNVGVIGAILGGRIGFGILVSISAIAKAFKDITSSVDTGNKSLDDLQQRLSDVNQELATLNGDITVEGTKRAIALETERDSLIEVIKARKDYIAQQDALRAGAFDFEQRKLLEESLSKTLEETTEKTKTNTEVNKENQKLYEEIKRSLSGAIDQYRPYIALQNEENEMIQMLNTARLTGLADYQTIETLKTSILKDNLRKRRLLEEQNINQALESIKAGKSREVDFENMTAEEKRGIIVGSAKSIMENLGQINKKAFQAYKAYQIAEATINAYKGASNAMATYPPPLNFLFAGVSLAQGLAQVAAIRSQQYSGRALGGRVQDGSTYMVGEQGPEMFVPSTSGTIIPNKDLGRATNVNITINANDTQGFDDLLVKRRSVIVNVINDALNSQGKEALV